MIILSIDSSTPVASVAVLDEAQILGEAMLNTKNTHSEKLLFLVEQLLQELQLTMEEVDAVAVAQGPGSFTGLRIGMATAKGLVQGSGKKLIAIPSLDALAYNMVGIPGLICPILNAKKNEVYSAIYRTNEQGELKRLSDYLAIKPELLADALQQYMENICFLGDGVPVYWELFANKLDMQIKAAPMNQMLPKASSIGVLALAKALREEYDDLYGCELIYIRKSEAEVQWEIKHGKTNG